MSRASVAVTKYNLDSYFYILQDLDSIVPMADKVDDKNKKTVKKSSTGSISKPKTTEKEKADDPHLNTRTPFLKMLLFLVTMKMTIMTIIILLPLGGKEVKLQPQFPWIFFTIFWESWMRDFLF